MIEELNKKYICYGYLIAKYFVHDNWSDVTLLPPRLFKISGCRSMVIPDYWCMPAVHVDSPEREKLKDWGLSDLESQRLFDRNGELLKDGKLSFVFPRYLNLKTAQDIVMEFVRGHDDVVLLGVGLPICYEEWLRGTHCYCECDFAQGGKVMGFDLINQFEDNSNGLTCSYTCNRLETEIFNVFGVKPNENGLYDSEEDAVGFCKYLEEKQLGEPGFWKPWLMVEYPSVQS